MGKNKQKTHKASSKRFRKTGSGKILQAKGHKSHFRRRRSKRSKREYQRMNEVGGTSHKKKIKKLAPNLDR
jgi:large subunit ribosomal protein L35